MRRYRSLQKICVKEQYKCAWVESFIAGSDDYCPDLTSIRPSGAAALSAGEAWARLGREGVSWVSAGGYGTYTAASSYTNQQKVLVRCFKRACLDHCKSRQNARPKSRQGP